MTVAIYGGSGYQAVLVASELRRRKIPTVLVGRSEHRLSVAAEALGDPAPRVRVAGLDRLDALVEALGDCDVVINCAGPFTVSGDVVARAAIAARTHYLDTSGEQLHIKLLFETVDGLARDAGVTVLPAANDGGVPGDLLAHLVAQRVEPVDEVISVHRIFGEEGASRGSLRSALHTKDTLAGGGLVYVDGTWAGDGTVSRTSIVLPGETETMTLARLPAPEVITVPRHTKANRVEALTDARLMNALTAVSAELIESVPPGPTEEARARGRFTIFVEATGQDGRTANGMVSGVDTYGTTAVIAAEIAQRLLVGNVPTGVVAAATAFPAVDLLDSLTQHGLRWSVPAYNA